MLEFLRFGRGEAHHTLGKTSRRGGDAAAGSDGEPPHLIDEVKRVIHLELKLNNKCSMDLIESGSCFGVAMVGWVL